MIATLVSLALAIGGMAGKDIDPSLPDSLGEPAVYLSEIQPVSVTMQT